MGKTSKITLILAAVMLAGAAFMPLQDDIYFLIKKNFSIFSKTYENIALEYVDEVDPEKLMRTGLEAMLETLDPYTVIYSESQNEEAEILSRGNYAGVGIEAGYREGRIVVVAPHEGGPAHRKGILAGDDIVAINGVTTSGLQPEETQTLMMGEEGSKVTVTIRRYGVEQDLDFELTRERIEIKNVTYSGFADDNKQFGYIKLAQFGEHAAEEVRQSLVSLINENQIKGLVLDLRDNPGGILQEAVSIIDKFVEPGLNVVENRGRLAEFNEIFKTKENVMFREPVVILMNGGSASASEVVAGALQDLDRAVIIGERSFGKGLVQIVKSLPYNTSMKITIARYYTPSGRSIQSVDYTHEGRNSGVVRGDAKNRKFKTRNGRDVFEGRGIEPDIKMEPAESSMLQVALLQNGMYFDYATKYYSEHNTESFGQLPSGTYTDFLSFLDSSGFSYKTTPEKELAELRPELEKISGAASGLDNLQKLIEEDKKSRLKAEQQKIEEMLFLEILSRFEGQKERIAAELKTDPQVRKAVEVLRSAEEWKTLLGMN